MSDLQARLLEAFKSECPEHLQGIRQALGSIRQGEASDDTFYDILRHAHTLKGAARAASLIPVEKAAHELETVISKAREEKTELSDQLVQAINHLLDLVETWVFQAPPERKKLPDLPALLSGSRSIESSAAEPEQRPANRSKDTVVRLEQAVLDSILLGAGEVLAQHSLQQNDSRRLSELLKGLRDLKSVLKTGTEGMARLEVLEVVCRDLMQQHRSRTANFHRTARQLFQAVSEARLIQADNVLTGMGRMVREVARAQGKSVRFLEAGMDTRVDRAVLQQMKAPILHALRNAVYHGIETPAERAAASKPETGQVKLSLELQETSLVITVSDDGRGVQVDEILRKAGEQGLTGPLEELLTAPQMTTAAEVSDIAGRGIGLSVARQALDALQGTLQVASQPGQGSRFILTVPVSLFSRLLVFVSCLGQLFAIQGHAVHSLIEVAHDRLESVEGRQMLRVDGELIPIAELSALISQGYPVSRGGETLSVVILKQLERKAALVVDGFETCKKMMIRPCSVPGMPLDTFAGTVTREDGSIGLVLSVPHLLRRAISDTRSKIARREEVAEVEPGPDWPASILVVDDSVTTRTLEKSILEANGYHVLVALDGLEALRILEQNRVDLVISDVEMPNLDGFGLLGKLKEDERLRDIPVVLLTSRRTREDQIKGLDLGAEAYLVKQEFDQLSLLETVRQLV